LRKEVIGLCTDERINSLYDEVRGDLGTFRKWYTGEAFDLDTIDNI
jgi:hypothetical protein